MSFNFIDPGPLIDRELQLVPPHENLIDAILKTCLHPIGRDDPMSRLTRQQLLDLIRAAPDGHMHPDPALNRAPAYQFWMKLLDEFQPPVPMAGSISLRIGDTEDLRRYLGHIGYNVFPAARGHHYAARACQLIRDLARCHGLSELWITCNPENIASRRTCEHIGAKFVDTVAIPVGHLLYQRGERNKCRYRLSI
jgi:tagatose 1,6-diphosphate aldolase